MRATVPLLAAMAAMATCRGRAPEQPAVAVATAEPQASSEPARPPITAPEPAPAEPVPGEPSPPTETEQAAEPSPAPTPSPPPQVVPIATPFSPRAVVMRPAVDTTPVVLFPDEKAALRRKVAAKLAASGVELVPIAELERIEAAAAEGRLVLEGDQRCRAPLTPEEVAARYFPEGPGRLFATVSAECFDGCRLRATVEDAPAFEHVKGWRSPEIARPHDPKAWLAAAKRLRPTEAFGIGMLGARGISHPPPVRFEPPIGIGPWAPAQPDGVPFEAVASAISGCAHPDPHAGLLWDVRASVDRRGHVTRCAAESTSPMAEAFGAACVCGVVETVRFPAGAAGRRLRVEAIDDAPFMGSVQLEPMQPGTEPWVRRLRQAPVLTRCLAANPMHDMLSARAILSLAPDGLVEDVRIEGDITTNPAMQLASCLVQELRAVPLPCRPPGVDALHLSLVVNGP